MNTTLTMWSCEPSIRRICDNDATLTTARLKYSCVQAYQFLYPGVSEGDADAKLRHSKFEDIYEIVTRVWPTTTLQHKNKTVIAAQKKQDEAAAAAAVTPYSEWLCCREWSAMVSDNRGSQLSLSTYNVTCAIQVLELFFASRDGTTFGPTVSFSDIIKNEYSEFLLWYQSESMNDIFEKAQAALHVLLFGVNADFDVSKFTMTVSDAKCLDGFVDVIEAKGIFATKDECRVHVITALNALHTFFSERNIGGWCRISLDDFNRMSFKALRATIRDNYVRVYKWYRFVDNGISEDVIRCIKLLRGDLGWTKKDGYDLVEEWRQFDPSGYGKTLTDTVSFVSRNPKLFPCIRGALLRCGWKEDGSSKITTFQRKFPTMVASDPNQPVVAHKLQKVLYFRGHFYKAPLLLLAEQQQQEEKEQEEKGQQQQPAQQQQQEEEEEKEEEQQQQQEEEEEEQQKSNNNNKKRKDAPLVDIDIVVEAEAFVARLKSRRLERDEAEIDAREAFTRNDFDTLETHVKRINYCDNELKLYAAKWTQLIGPSFII